MHENEIASIIVDACFKVHTVMGPGLLESVYETALSYELEQRGLKVVRQQAIPIVYEGLILGEAFRADIVVEDKVIIELKSLETIAQVHKKQLVTYLRLSGKKLGFLVNFGSNLIRDGITRIVNGL